MIPPYLCKGVGKHLYEYQFTNHPTKKAVRIIHNASYLDHTNILFLKSHILKFADLVKFKTVQIMYRARYNLLPYNVQNIFLDKVIRVIKVKKKPQVQTTLKIMCISLYGVTLWNALDDELQQSKNINQFKDRINKFFFGRYRLEEEGDP